MDYLFLFNLAIAIALIVAAPYIVTFFLNGAYGALRSFRIVREYFKLLTGTSGEKTPTETRMQSDLDRMEKNATGLVTRIEPPTPPSSTEPGGVFVDSPTPDEEKQLAEAEMEQEQRELKEKLAKKDQVVEPQK